MFFWGVVLKKILSLYPPTAQTKPRRLAASPAGCLASEPSPHQDWNARATIRFP